MKLRRKLNSMDVIILTFIILSISYVFGSILNNYGTHTFYVLIFTCIMSLGVGYVWENMERGN